MPRKGEIEVTSHIELSGPLFVRDPKKTVRENIGDFLDRLHEAMEKDVKDSITAHAGSMPGYSGWSWAHTVGRRRSRRTGKTWALWAVVSANTDGLNREDAIRTKAAAVTIEKRWHPYRNSTRIARRMIRSLDLTRGLD